MNALAQRLANLPSSIGWTGGIGLALLVSAAVLTLALLLPAREQSEVLRQELRHLERKSGPVASPAQSATHLRQRLGEFMSSLPRQDQINAQLTLLHELAARNRLALRNGEYRTGADKGGRIGRVQITVKVEGSYTDFRRFLQEVPATLPALSLSRIAMSRQKPSDTALETNVEFALFYTRVES